ncbi:hypothetical protein TPChic_0093a [Treponema pallidum subsp. pallidum str. Chicago]|nr:hypothetical protein TPChic_0093a [Treponema pallidum subsp. pallidum str. Chicago]
MQTGTPNDQNGLKRTGNTSARAHYFYYTFAWIMGKRTALLKH